MNTPTPAPARASTTLGHTYFTHPSVPDRRVRLSPLTRGDAYPPTGIATMQFLYDGQWYELASISDYYEGEMEMMAKAVHLLTMALDPATVSYLIDHRPVVRFLP